MPRRTGLRGMFIGRGAMGRRHARLVVALLAANALALAAKGPRAKPAAARRAAASGQSSRNAVLCRVLEVKILPPRDLSLVLFHEAQPSQGPRFAALLRANDGAPVQFTTGSSWHPATVLRLGDCFGRGLLVLPAAHLHLEKRELFHLRFLHPPRATHAP